MRKTALVVVTIVLAAAAILGYIFVLVPARARQEAERLMKRYAAAPDQQTANRLIELLCKRRVPKEQGDRIFELLLTPRVEVRSAYRSDRPVFIAVGRASDLSFRDCSLRIRHDLRAGGESLYKGSSGGNHLSPGPFYEGVSWAASGDGRVVPVDGPGTYTVNVVREYELHEGGVLLHSCAFDIPVTIHVLDPEHAEHVAVLSAPALDAKMKAAMTLTTQSAEETYSTPSGEYTADIGCWIVATSPPENAAFRCSYRDDAGFTKPFPEFTVLARSGTAVGAGLLPSWGSMLPIRELQLETGHYKGVIILETDEEIAYRDPAMKTIWGGALEFPIEFEVTRVK